LQQDDLLLTGGLTGLEQPQTGEYWNTARQPLHCLLFLLPLLGLYETGVLWMARSGAFHSRNGADDWMRSGLNLLGFRQPLLLPLIMLGVLAGWQIAGRFDWRISGTALVGMLAESLLFGAILVVLGQLQVLAFGQKSSMPHEALRLASDAGLPRAISYLGAGLYEELLFRMGLLPVCYGFLRIVKVPRPTALGLAIAASSLLFSAAHYVGPAADVFSPFTFAFRVSAGVFFAGLFVVRGFGITVGAHAAYDLLVGVFLAPQ
jgi:Type II CAAX prenyl endopeptidase Rce1-like